MKSIRNIMQGTASAVKLDELYCGRIAVLCSVVMQASVKNLPLSSHMWKRWHEEKSEDKKSSRDPPPGADRDGDAKLAEQELKRVDNKLRLMGLRGFTKKVKPTGKAEFDVINSTAFGKRNLARAIHRRVLLHAEPQVHVLFFAFFY